jgi:hypothetical protein
VAEFNMMQIIIDPIAVVSVTNSPAVSKANVLVSSGESVMVSPHRDKIRPRLPQKQKLPPDPRQWL